MVRSFVDGFTIVMCMRRILQGMCFVDMRKGTDGEAVCGICSAMSQRAMLCTLKAVSYHARSRIVKFGASVCFEISACAC